MNCVVAAVQSRQDYGMLASSRARRGVGQPSLHIKSMTEGSATGMHHSDPPLTSADLSAQRNSKTTPVPGSHDIDADPYMMTMPHLVGSSGEAAPAAPPRSDEEVLERGYPQQRLLGAQARSHQAELLLRSADVTLIQVRFPFSPYILSCPCPF